MLEKLAPRVGQIACDKRGTHALQASTNSMALMMAVEALIGLLQLEDEQQQLMPLGGRPNTCCVPRNAMKCQVVELSPGANLLSTCLKHE